VGISPSLNLTPLQQEHTRFMQAIVQSMCLTPYVLKGGTALYFGYGLNRFSEDLDFDAPLKINMESKIKASLPNGFTNLQIETIKNTETVQRYRVSYTTSAGKGKLKIETSFRDSIPPKSHAVIDGMKIYKIDFLLDKKLKAAHDGQSPRTAIRDLYDLCFIAENYCDCFTDELFSRIKSFSSDLDELNQRYGEAYLNDEIVNTQIELEDLLLRLERSANFIERSLKLSPHTENP